jgi:hypothetical protein
MSEGVGGCSGGVLVKGSQIRHRSVTDPLLIPRGGASMRLREALPCSWARDR